MRSLNSLNTFLLVTFALAATACGSAARDPGSETTATGRPVGEIRGTDLINTMIRARMLDASSPQTESFAIERVAGQQIFGMRAMLGQYTDGGSAEFRGGEPNPFGLMLWHQVAVRFAQGLAAGCGGTGSVNFSTGGVAATLSPGFKDKLNAVCAWPATDDARKTAASKLWTGIAGFGSPDEETAFVEAFAAPNSVFATETPSARVEAMIAAVVLNPQVLLER